MLEVAAVTPTFDPNSMPPEPVKRWTVDEYFNLIRLGVLAEDDPYELLEGWLVTKLTHNPLHDFVLGRLSRLLHASVGGNWVLRTQSAIALIDGAPEPDFAICRAPDEQYIGRHPEARDLALVIEVSDSSLARDRGIKLRSYARAGIVEYWIVNVQAQQVEIYTSPQPGTVEPNYTNQRVVSRNETVHLVLEGNDPVTIDVASLFPSA